MNKIDRFGSMSNYDLAVWLGQYGRSNAGFYPGLRKQRAAAEREAAKRGTLPVVYIPRRWPDFTRPTLASELRRQHYIRKGGA